MSGQPGQRGYIEQDKTDTLYFRAIADDNTEITISGTPTIVVYASGGTELVPSTSATGSGSTLSYSRSWASATFSRDHGYKAVWTFSDGSTTYTRTQYFSVVRRRFRSTLTDADLTSLHQYLSNQNQQVDLSIFRKEAWEEIETMCRVRIRTARDKRRSNTRSAAQATGQRIDDYPGNFFHPEDFRQAHLLLTAAWFFEHSAFGDLDTNTSKGEHFRSRGLGAFELSASKMAFDRDDDGLMDSWEEEFSFAGFDIVR